MNDIINKIRKYYHNENNIMEIIFDNYDGLHYYIRLDEDKKKPLCYLRSYNLDLLDKFDKKLINQEVLNDKLVEHIYLTIEEYNAPLEYNTCTSDINIAEFIIKKDNKKYKYKFNLFIPKEIEFLKYIVSPIVTNLPGRLSELFFELNAGINGTTEKYMYNKEFKFDLLKGDLSKVFAEEVIKNGQQYYKENRVRFVEEISGAYYAIVNGNNDKLYSVIINYDKKKHITALHCNCPCQFKCKHMYAVIEHIRRKEYYRFYKVLYLNEESDQMYDKLFSDNTYLCVGINNKSIILMMPNGELHMYNALDEYGNLLYKVIEDDEENGLQKELEKIKELD